MHGLLDDLSTEDLQKVVASGKPVVALVPVGSVEPHGPHLPIGTDTRISDVVAAYSSLALDQKGHHALVAPPIPYGVTDFAGGFPGAVSIPAQVLTAFLRAVVTGYLESGVAHVCLINNHLEPEQDRAVRAAVEGLPAGHASVACPLTKRWARTLSDEFKSGACHAGRYETSLILAADRADGSHPAQLAGRALPALDISLSRGIKEGKKTFREMGMDRAYTGAPAEATREEGEDLLRRLTTMVVTEVIEGLAARAAANTTEERR